jgi:RNA polymerase sigma-70 factor (ECF subfamily)
MSDELSDSEPAAVDDDLVVRARTDRAAFGTLYERYFPAVARYCLRRLSDRAGAEDVTSEVFLQVASHLGSFAGGTETDFRRWLFRIATNAVNAHLRQAGRRRQLWEAAARSGSLDRQANPASSQAAHDRLDWPAVYEALLELDERDQTIIMLRFFADCSHDEIAEIVGANVGAVRTALSRALGRLRERLSPIRPSQPEV